jgi:hypothetical protein
MIWRKPQQPQQKSRQMDLYTLSYGGAHGNQPATGSSFVHDEA